MTSFNKRSCCLCELTALDSCHAGEQGACSLTAALPPSTLQAYTRTLPSHCLTQCRQYLEMPRDVFEARSRARQAEFQQLSVQIGHIQLAIQQDQDQVRHECLP